MNVTNIHNIFYIVYTFIEKITKKGGYGKPHPLYFIQAVFFCLINLMF